MNPPQHLRRSLAEVQHLQVQRLNFSNANPSRFDRTKGLYVLRWSIFVLCFFLCLCQSSSDDSPLQCDQHPNSYEYSYLSMNSFEKNYSESFYLNPFAPRHEASDIENHFQEPVFQINNNSDTQHAGVPFPLFQIGKALEVDKGKQENFVFSPCSIQLALSLIANGASGSTLEELLKFLEARNLDHLNSIATTMVNSLTRSIDGGPKLSFHGGVWVDQSFPLKAKFKEDAERIYKMNKVSNVDFQNEVTAREAIDEVNEWVKATTNGHIKELLPNGSYNSDTRLLLPNTLYFNGKWTERFQELYSSDSAFHLLDGRLVVIPFMGSSERQYIGTYDDFKVLRLGYLHSTLSMYVILPDKVDGLGALMERVSSDAGFLDRHTSRYIESVPVGRFRIPKFKIMYQFEASKILQRMGLKLPFSGRAEFAEMVHNIKFDDWLKIDKVHHKSYIEINEEGTEAAAATVREDILGMDWCCDPNTVHFVADHAFMFVVKDDQSGMVLFMGHVTNPFLE